MSLEGWKTCCPRLDRGPWHRPGSLFSEPLSQASQARVKRYPQGPPWPLPCESPLPTSTGSTLPPPHHTHVHSQDTVTTGWCLSSGYQDSGAGPCTPGRAAHPATFLSRVAWVGTRSQLCPFSSPNLLGQNLHIPFLKNTFKLCKKPHTFFQQREGGS